MNGDILILRNGLYSNNFYADVGCHYNVASKRCQYQFRSNYYYLWKPTKAVEKIKKSNFDDNKSLIEHAEKSKNAVK